MMPPLCDPTERDGTWHEGEDPMDALPIRYARTSRGDDVAYWRAGSGPALVTSGVGHTRAAHDFELPVFAEFYGRLIDRFEVIRFDDPGRLTDDGSLDRWNEGAIAVAKSAALDRFAVLTVWPHGSLHAAYFAQQHPTRVTHLVVWSPGLEVPEPVRVIGSLQQDYPDLGRELRTFWQGFDESVQAWTRMHEAERSEVPSRSLTPVLETMERRAQQVAPGLEAIQVPVLAMYRRDALIDYGLGARAFAAAIPGALLVPVGGRGTSIVADEQDAIVEMIAAFVAEPSEERDNPTDDVGEPVSIGPLSSREIEVLWHVARGESNAAIARNLGLAESTIATHVSNILAKTQAANRAEAVHIATRHGLLSD